ALPIFRVVDRRERHLARQAETDFRRVDAEEAQPEVAERAHREGVAVVHRLVRRVDALRIRAEAEVPGDLVLDGFECIGHGVLSYADGAQGCRRSATAATSPLHRARCALPLSNPECPRMTSTRASTADKRRAFHQLHAAGCFVIPSPWDVGSARMLQGLGFKALATTSSGFAWSHGRADNSVTRDMVLAHLADIVAATDVP